MVQFREYCSMTGMGGPNLRKLEEWKHCSFLFYTDFLYNILKLWYQKSVFSCGNFRCEFRAPLAFGTFWPPLPYPSPSRYFGRENSLTSTANSVSSAQNLVSSFWRTNNSYERNSLSPPPWNSVLKTPPYKKYYAILILQGVVNLLFHHDVLWRPPRADIIFLGFTGSSFEKRVHTVVKTGDVVKTLWRSNSLSRSVFSPAGSFGVRAKKKNCWFRCLKPCSPQKSRELAAHHQKRQTNGPAEVQCEFFGTISGLNFQRWILGGEFLEGEFFGGPLLLEKTESKNSTQEFGFKIRASKIRFAEFGPKFAFRRRKNPLCRLLSLTKRTTKKCTIKTYSFDLFFRGPRISLFIRSGVGCGGSSCLLGWFRKGPLKRGQRSTFWWCIFFVVRFDGASGACREKGAFAKRALRKFVVSTNCRYFVSYIMIRGRVPKIVANLPRIWK